MLEISQASRKMIARWLTKRQDLKELLEDKAIVRQQGVEAFWQHQNRKKITWYTQKLTWLRHEQPSKNLKSFWHNQVSW